MSITLQSRSCVQGVITLAMTMRRFDFTLDKKFHPEGECGMTTGATIHTVGGLHVKLTRRPGTGGDEMLFDGAAGHGQTPGQSLDQLIDVDMNSGSPDVGTSESESRER